jgi:protein involved in polysaccharide export with SLBB domain
VGGEVLAPGRFPWTNGVTLLDGLRRAGGYSLMADPTRIEIRSSGISTQFCSFAVASSNPAKNPRLKPGDLVMVPRGKLREAGTKASAALGFKGQLPPPNWTERSISVEGEVRQPGRLIWTNEMRFSTAIELAGGLTELADPARVQIRHYNGAADPANYIEAIKSPQKDNVLIRGDRVLVPRKEQDK